MYIYVCIFTPRLSVPRSTLVAVEFVSDAILPVPRVCTVGITRQSSVLYDPSEGLRTLSLGLIVSETKFASQILSFGKSSLTERRYQHSML